MGQGQQPIDPRVAAAFPDTAQASLDYNTGLQALQWQQALAENLLKQGQAPYSSGMAGNMAYRVSPLEGLAHALSSGLGAYMGSDAISQMKTLAKQYGEAIKQSAQPQSGGAAQSASTGAASAADGRVASVRNNNPGAMWPGPVASQYGATGAQNLNDGQGNKIATFPDPVSGAAAHFALLAKDYAGMPLSAAIQKWSGGNSSSEYTQAVSKATGLTPNTILTPQLIASPQGVELAKAMARQEAGGEYPLSQEGWTQAQARAFGGSGVPAQPAQNQPVAGQAGGPIWRNPGMPADQARYAFAYMPDAWEKAYIADLKNKAPTPEQKMLAGSNLSPQQQQEQLALTAQGIKPPEGMRIVQTPSGPQMEPIAGAMEAKGQTKAVEAAAAETGKAAGEYPSQLQERGTQATNMLRTISELKNLNTNPGVFAGVKEDVGRFFRSMGASDETIQKYLKVSPGNLEASQKLTAQMAVEAVKQISPKSTQLEFQKFLEANPNIFQTPEGFKRVTQYLEGVANGTLREQAAFLDWKQGKRPDQYNDFPHYWNQMQAEEVRQGKFNSTPVQPPQAVGATPPQQATPAIPKLGDVQLGHRFKGGDPSKPESWEKL